MYRISQFAISDTDFYSMSKSSLSDQIPAMLNLAT